MMCVCMQAALQTREGAVCSQELNEFWRCSTARCHLGDEFGWEISTLLNTPQCAVSRIRKGKWSENDSNSVNRQ